MRYVELHPGISSSVLGFGCAPIMGSVDGPTARHALSVALEEGITHFDVARCYGFGQAERLLGECIRHRRRDLVIASKYGIFATAAARALGVLKPVVRLLKRRPIAPLPSPSGKPKNTSKSPLQLFSANILLKRVRLQAAEMQCSLERSLRELRTDYLDYFFLHEPLEAIVEIDDLLAKANQMKQAGKIRAFGLAFMQEQAGLHTRYLSHFDLLQMDNSPFRPDYAQSIAHRKSLPSIFFSPLRGSLAGPAAQRASSATILRQIQTDFPKSVILVSMFREAHIRENARSF